MASPGFLRNVFGVGHGPSQAPEAAEQLFNQKRPEMKSSPPIKDARDLALEDLPLWEMIAILPLLWAAIAILTVVEYFRKKPAHEIAKQAE